MRSTSSNSWFSIQRFVKPMTSTQESSCRLSMTKTTSGLNTLRPSISTRSNDCPMWITRTIRLTSWAGSQSMKTFTSKSMSVNTSKNEQVVLLMKTTMKLRVLTVKMLFSLWELNWPDSMTLSSKKPLCASFRLIHSDRHSKTSSQRCRCVTSSRHSSLRDSVKTSAIQSFCVVTTFERIWARERRLCDQLTTLTAQRLDIIDMAFISSYSDEQFP